MNRKELERIRLLPVLGFVLAFFLVFNISVFAIEDEANNLPAEGEVIEAEIEVEEPAVTSNNLAEPEELLDNYIEVITEEIAQEHNAVSFEAKNGIIPSKLRGDKLTGVDKAVYDILREKIEDVAKGKNVDKENEDQNGLTAFTVGLADIYSEDMLTARYSASDLNVETLVVDGVITEEASELFQELYYPNIRKVLIALLSDCPYQLFWFDKTIGIRYEGGPAISGDNNSG